MIETIAFVMIMGVCAPFDHDDCKYNLQWTDLGVWGVFLDRTIYFDPEHWLEIDCFGLSVWQHEWLHAEIGNFHPNGDTADGNQCSVKPEFQHAFDNSYMVTNARS